MALGTLNAIAEAAISLADLLRSPLVSNVEISPDGRRLSYISYNEKDKGTLLFFDFETGKTSGIGTDGDDVFGARWLSSESVFLLNRGRNASFSMYTFGEKRPKAVLTAFTSRIVLSFRKFDPGTAYIYYPPDSYVRGHSGLAIVDITRHDVRVGAGGTRQAGVVKWLDMPKGKYLWARADTTGRLRTLTMLEGVDQVYYYRSNDDEPWLRLHFPYETTEVAGFHPDGHSLYIFATDPSLPTAGLFTYDTQTKKVGPLVYSDPEYSISDGTLLLEPKTGELWGITYARDRTETRPLSPQMANIMSKAKAALPGWAITVSNWDDIGHRLVLLAQADRLPFAYFIYDLATEKIQGMPAPKPWLTELPISETRTVRWQARDGVPLEGYLTLPLSYQPGKALPTVVLAHGGPWSRDDWVFDTEVEILVNQGYAVFRPNYRGSSGYPYAVSEADAYDFRKMHNDVTDGIKYLVNTGFADGDRLAIMGGSFGGFLAVAGAAWEPELYQCAITIVGVFDWANLIKYDKWKDNDYRVALYQKHLGDPKSNPDAYQAISPIHDVASIKIPIYISHGKTDPNVDADQSRALISALKKNGKTYESFLVELEGHGYSEMKNRVRFYSEALEFLAKNLK